MLLDQPAGEVPAAHAGVAQHRHRQVVPEQGRHRFQPVGRSAQRQVQAGMGQPGLLQLPVFTHVHDLDRLPPRQTFLQVRRTDGLRHRGTLGRGHGEAGWEDGRMEPSCSNCMRARPFLAVVLAVTLLAFALGLAGWWMVWRHSPLQLQHHPLTVPRAARFVPRQAPLSLFVFSDGEEPVGYARAVAPPRERRAAAAAVERLRDGAFAAAGLDYPSELASWLAPEIGFAVIDAPLRAEPGDPGGWLMALRSRDEEGARRFLQRFWQTRSLAGADLRVTRYRGMGLISGRGALLGRRPLPLATALVDDDLVLIASGRGVLEQALDVSQVDELNLAAQPRMEEALQQLGQGAALLLARPAAFEPWLGLPLPPEEAARPSLLVAALRPDGRSLRLDALLDSLQVSEAPDPDPTSPQERQRQWQPLLAGRIVKPERLALLRNPAFWLNHPLLSPLLQRSLPQGTPGGDASAGPLPDLVAQADTGPLLLAEGQEGWILGTLADRPPLEALEPALVSRGLIAAPLAVGNDQLTVWTRLQAASGRPGRRQEASGGDRLEASLVGWRTERDGLAWWGGRSLGMLAEKGAGRDLQRRERQLETLGATDPVFQWAMARRPALDLLQPWQPWRLLAALAGGGLEGPVQGMSLAFAPDGPSLHLQGRLELGSS